MKRRDFLVSVLGLLSAGPAVAMAAAEPALRPFKVVKGPVTFRGVEIEWVPALDASIPPSRVFCGPIYTTKACMEELRRVLS